jgi:hypothetical protein
MHVYVDESGDLGFTPKSTQFFVVAYLILEYPFEVEKKMKRLLKKLHKNKKYARGYNELKFAQSSEYVRRQVLQKICQCSLEIGFIVLEKAKVKEDLRKSPTILYNFVIVDRIMKNVLPRLNPTDRLDIVVDKSLPASSIDAFNDYAKSKASWLLNVRWGKSDGITISNIRIRHENSQKEPCLQAADYLAGACFRRYEFGDASYYEMIKRKVRYFDYLW